MGEGGADMLLGGIGDDLLVGDAGGLAEAFHGADRLEGGEGADTLFGNGKDDTLFGGAGSDTLEGDSSDTPFDKHGADYLDGGEGADKLQGDGGADTLVGGEGGDQLFGDSDDTPLSNQGDDYLDGEAGDDYLRAYAGNDTLYGGDGADQLLGEAGADYLSGEAGDDLVSGGDDADSLAGGLGNDDLQGDAGADVLEGGEGNDRLFGGADADFVAGDAGDDQLAGDGGDDFLLGDEGADRLFGHAGADRIFGGAGDDGLVGGSENDALYGEAGNDVFLGEAGADEVYGGEGNDQGLGGEGNDAIYGEAGNDEFDGEAGNDRISGGEGLDTLIGGAGDDLIDGEQGVDTLAGGEGADRLIGGDGGDVIGGDGGEDVLLGGVGNDSLYGNAGNDRLEGEVGDDLLVGGTGNDLLMGGAGNDTYVYEAVANGADTIVDSTAGGEVNTLLFPFAYAPGLVRLGLGSLLLDFGDGNVVHLEGFDPEEASATSPINAFQFQNVTLTLDQLLAQGFDLEGTSGADVLTGTPFDDRINAHEGDDVVQARSGNDTVLAGDGVDAVHGGDGEDVLDAGAGDDLVDAGEGNDSVLAGAGADIVFGGAGDDAIEGGADDDSLFGDEGADTLYGGAGADSLAGGAGDDSYTVDESLDTIIENAGEGNDRINASVSTVIAENVEVLALTGTADLTGTGNAGENVLLGNAGANALYGLEGNDQLQGGFGDDLMDGGAGADAMYGSIGDDVYVVDDAADTVEEAEDFYDRRLIPDASGNWGTLVESGGEDTVESGVTVTLGQFVENLVLTGTEAIDGTGTVEENTLEGNEAGNALYGYRTSGAVDPFPTGSPFIQQFVPQQLFGPAQELVLERANVEIFRGRAQWFVPLNVDLAPGSGDDLYGMGGDDRLYGTLDNDYLEGGEGNDLLHGFAGSDVMVGGAGDDTYVVSGDYDFFFPFAGGEHAAYSDAGLHVDDLVEEVNGGIDTVVSEIDFALPDEFENLTLVIDTREHDAEPGLSYSPDRGEREYARVGEGNALDNILTGNQLNNDLYGFEGADTLYGGEGFDYLEGGTGADRMEGGGGSDTFEVEDAGDVVIEVGAPDVDEVQSWIDYTLTANVENLTLFGETFEENLSGAGNELANRLTGNDGANALSGLAGDDVLDGGFGDDAMTGGAGDDTYYVDSDLDVTAEELDAGRDTVYASISHTLGENLEDLVLTGENFDYGEGNALDNRITGDGTGNDLEGFEGADTLLGNGGNDSLFGDEGDDALDGGEGGDFLEGDEGNDTLQGGADGDFMAGGSGDDTYYVDSDSDAVVEDFDEGIDTVFEQNQFFYNMPENVESTTVIGDYQDLDREFSNEAWVFGNALDNGIVGSDATNRLQGQGGADTIDGRAGSDSLFGDEDGDTIYGGDDALRGRLVYLNSYGEEVSFWDEDAKPAFIGDLELAQNSDELAGGLGDDALDGGSGDDRLAGEEGDDVLYGGDDGLIGDVVDEGSGGEEGSGQQSDVGETDEGRVFLRNQDTLEGGAGDDTLDGGSDDDRLFGGEGEDTLIGGADGPLNERNDDSLDGGAGLDSMAGGTGDDEYVLDGTYEDTVGTVFDDCGEPIFDAPIRLWATDAIVENAGEGYDRVLAYADTTLTDNVEELRLASFDASGSTTIRFGRGSEGANTIFGNEFDNRLEGAGGDDRLFGQGGNDVLEGGAGDDALDGGAGDDVYNVGAGGGRDVVARSVSGFDTVHFTQDLPASSIVATRQGDDAVLGVAGTGDRITLDDWFDSVNRVQAVEFCDDPAWDEATIAALANARIDPIEALDDAAAVGEDGALTAAGNVLANDTNADPMGLLRISAPGSFAGVYGTLQLSADGSYAYALDNDSTLVQSLAEGESAFESFTYEAADLSGAYAEALLEIEIAGANDAPEFGAGGAGAVTEDAGTLERFALGNLIRDGGFESGTAFWRLGGNESFTGTDFLAESGRAFFSGASAEPTLLAQELETDPARYLLEFSLLGGAASGTEFNVSWDGATLLTVADTGQDDYRRYQVVLQGTGEESLLAFSFRNDPGFWHLDEVSLGLLEEEFIPADFHRAEGELEFTDIDSLDEHTLVTSPRGDDYVGSLDTFIVRDSTGGATGQVAWEFSVGNDELQFLSEGETLDQVYDLTVSDESGASATQSVTVTLAGANDAPTFDDISAFAAEDDILAAEGNVLEEVFDADEADVLTVATPGTYAGSYGTLELAADGSYLYTLDNGSAAVQSLAEGEAVEDRFEFDATDGRETVRPPILVEIDGTNDAPVAAADAASVEEDGALAASGNVLLNDTDVDAGSSLEVVNFGSFAGGFGTLVLGQDGGYTYALDNAAVQFLAAGETVTEVFSYEASDGLASSAGELTVTIAGANDAPELPEDLAAVGEDGVLAAAGNVLANDADADASDVLTVANAGSYAGTFGTLELAADGGYVYALDNNAAAVQALAAGQVVQDSFGYVAGDGIDSGMSLLTVTVAGANDAPVTAADAAEVGEDAESVASGNVLANDSDVDAGTVLVVSNPGPQPGSYGSFTLDADGGFTYTLDNAAPPVQALRGGQVVTEVFGYIASDSLAEVPGAVTVRITGANDNPDAVDDEASLHEDGPLSTIGNVLANDSDADAGTVLAVANAGTFAGVYGTLTLAADGGYTYAFEAAAQSLAAGELATDSFVYLAVDDDAAPLFDAAMLRITLTGANDAPLLANAIPDQEAQAGSAWSFVVAAGTFTDIDAGDVLTYAATLGDGSALPSWLSFDAVTRTFSGTPPGTSGGGGGGDDCGCGAGGGDAPSSLDLRVVATDTAGASAQDSFTLNIAGGGGSGIAPIVGTDGDDVLTGTSGNDVIDGREGYDRMSGGAGDDVYYVDETCGRVDLVTENPGEGRDTVYSQANATLGANIEELHLVGRSDLDGKGNALANILVGNAGDNKLQGGDGNDLLLDDAGRDRLEGGAGDDVMDGGAGDDTLAGGAGNDLFVHAAGGGDDAVQDSGGTDAIRFGEGITQSQVAARRSGNDLSLRLSSGNGSVTVKDWFASSAKRVESVQFADGTSWDEAAIRARLEGGGSHQGGHGDDGYGCDDGRSGQRGRGHEGDDEGWDGHHGGRHDRKDHHGDRRGGHGDDCEDCGTDEMRDAITQRLRRNPNYDFTALTAYLARNGGGGYGAMSADQIAAQWLAVQNCVGSLAKAEDDDDSHGHGGHGHGHHGWGGDDDRDGRGHGWGHVGSTGRHPGWGGMEAFSGLGEGFRKL